MKSLVKGAVSNQKSKMRVAARFVLYLQRFFCWRRAKEDAPRQQAVKYYTYGELCLVYVGKPIQGGPTDRFGPNSPTIMQQHIRNPLCVRGRVFSVDPEQLHNVKVIKNTIVIDIEDVSEVRIKTSSFVFCAREGEPAGKLPRFTPRKSMDPHHCLPRVVRPVP